jgi:hypothetical protein
MLLAEGGTWVILGSWLLFELVSKARDECSRQMLTAQPLQMSVSGPS